VSTGLVVALLLAQAAPVAPESPSPESALSLTLRPTPARLGEWIEAEVTGRLPPGARLVEPTFHGAGRLEILESAPLPASEGWFRWRLRLVGFESGRQLVPPLSFRCRGDGVADVELLTSTVELEVQDPSLPKDAELRPLRPPVALPLTRLERLAAVIGAGLVILASSVALRWLRRPKPQAAEVAPPPRERALGDLRDLEREIPVPAPRAAEFYGRVMEVMRGFLSAAEGLEAFHMTSGQILDSAGSRAQPGARRALADVLGAADEVRFGGGLPDGGAQAGHIASAKDAVGSWSAEREKGGGGGVG
jgi:hypothetical protein